MTKWTTISLELSEVLQHFVEERMADLGYKSIDAYFEYLIRNELERDQPHPLMALAAKCSPDILEIIDRDITARYYAGMPTPLSWLENRIRELQNQENAKPKTLKKNNQNNS